MTRILRANRRAFLKTCSAISVGAFAGLPRTSLANAAILTRDKHLPNITHGISAGDVTADSATIWSRCDRPASMTVDVALDESFSRVIRKFDGTNALPVNDLTSKVDLSELPGGHDLFYRVTFADLNNPQRMSQPATGRLRTASSSQNQKDVCFAWSGDTAGQGFGIDVSRGGMKTYESIRQQKPDFMVHSGDVCYSDNPFESEKQLADGTVWKNLVTESTSKVAETLHEFRGNFRYNLLDENVRRMNAEVPVIGQWDDHETLNNWYPGELLHDDRYSIRNVSLLAGRARQAFFEYMPISMTRGQQIYRSIPYGPRLQMFFLDMRSFRSANSGNRQTTQGTATRFLGQQQIQWLKKNLMESTSTWKFICSDMPIGLMVGDGKNFENCANGDGPALGRELEIAELLSFIKRKEIRNVVWITADVHYSASHFYDPGKARFNDFEPFWEFVSGPLHAGTFGPGKLDDTFGPQVRFTGIPEGMEQNRPPSDGFQFFGVVRIDGESGKLNVAHHNRDGKKLWDLDLNPEP